MDQGSSFTSKAVKSFCNSEGIEIVYSPVNDQRVSKFGGVMMDRIFKERRNKGKGAKERETN